MSERVQLVTFALGGETFAATVGEVERVLRVGVLERMPGTPDWLAGFAEHEGRSLPVVNLRLRFGLPPAPAGTEPRIVVSGSVEPKMGLMVDSVVAVVAVAEHEMEPPPPVLRGLPGEYVRGTFRHDGRLVVVLRVGRLLSGAERLVLYPASRGG